MSIKKCKWHFDRREKSKFSHSFPGETLDFHFYNMLSDSRFDYNALCATEERKNGFYGS